LSFSSAAPRLGDVESIRSSEDVRDRRDYRIDLHPSQTAELFDHEHRLIFNIGGYNSGKTFTDAMIMLDRGNFDTGDYRAAGQGTSRLPHPTRPMRENKRRLLRHTPPAPGLRARQSPRRQARVSRSGGTRRHTRNLLSY
jgi:hypothetical protein